MVSPAEAESFLEARFGGAVQDLSGIGHGEWSQAYAFRRDGADYVVRFSALEEDFRKDQLAVRYAVANLPIPPIAEIGEAFGGFYAIAERATGAYLDDLDESRMRATLPSLFAALDAMRQAEISASQGYGPWGADGNAPHATWRDALLDIANDRTGDRIHGWRARLVSSPTGDGPFDRALEEMRVLTAYCPEARHLIHSDLLNFNVLVAGARMSAVIDWGCAMYGDFLYDLAWFCFWAPWYPAWQGIDFAEEGARHFAAFGLDVPHYDERLRCYQIHIGLASQAYCAFKERWDMLAEVATRTSALTMMRPDNLDRED
jgi:hygromycin-B 4-O-kinase